MRINKYLADHGYATRRGADELIERGIVYINGTKAVLGQYVKEGDTVTVKLKKRKQPYRYVAYFKPRGVITHSPQKGENDIRAELKGITELEGLFPVGRLDKDSSGLILLTDDGRVTARLLSPDNNHEKEYRVRTRTRLRDSFKKHMEAGVNIEGYITKPAKVTVTGDHSFTITVTEGKKHQIRRMVVAMHNEVKDLVRTRILNIRTSGLQPGDWRFIEGPELERFLGALNLPKQD